MGQDVIAEKDFPCPCGNGTIQVQVVEHDTYGSGRHSRYSVECRDCRQNWVAVDTVLARTLFRAADAEEMQRRNSEIFRLKKEAGAMAVARYREQWVAHVLGIRFKTSMHTALGGHSSLNSFRQQATTPERIEKLAEDALDDRPEHCLERLGVNDADLNERLQNIRQLKQELREMEQRVEKFQIPRMDIDE
jgi:hypothetical protein